MSSSTTSRYGLHIWDDSDYVLRSEFNTNFQKLDEETAKKSDFDAHVAAKNPHGLAASDIGAQILGSNNKAVNKVKAVEHKIDTRSTVLTYTDGLLTKVEEKDGSTVVKETVLNYSGGVLSTVTETAGGTKVTYTLNYTSGNLTSITKAVV